KEPMRGLRSSWMAILLFSSVLVAEARPGFASPYYRPLVRFRHKDGISQSLRMKALLGRNGFLNPCEHKYCGLGKHCVVDHASGQGECQCLDHCKPHYKPVCGSNGKLYENHCELHRDSCLTRQRITIVHSEECFYK
ncbi:follistatin-related protein 5 isoform X2, partial [Clarias magur]